MECTNSSDQNCKQFNFRLRRDCFIKDTSVLIEGDSIVITEQPYGYFNRRKPAITSKFGIEDILSIKMKTMFTWWYLIAGILMIIGSIIAMSVSETLCFAGLGMVFILFGRYRKINVIHKNGSNFQIVSSKKAPAIEFIDYISERITG